MRTFHAAALAATVFTGAASAGLFDGMAVTIDGEAGPQIGGTMWGSWAQMPGEGPHILGTVSQFSDSHFPTFFVVVSSTVVTPPPGYASAAEFTFDFSAFSPQDFTNHWIRLMDLAADGGSISDVTATQGTISTDGNSVFWQGLGAALSDNPRVTIGVFHVPPPGAIGVALLPLLAGGRRRRA